MKNADIKILLVDDDEMIRECVTAYLEDEGFTVVGTSTAEEALEIIAGFTPLVCIADMTLPGGMNGDEFILKAHAVSPETSYMLHTGKIYTLTDELKAIGMKPDDVLLKPIHDLSKLVEKIKIIAARWREL